MLILTCEQVLREYLGEPFAVETTLVNETDINRKFPDVIICSHRMASLQKLRQHLNFSTQIEDLAQDVIEKIQKGEEVDQGKQNADSHSFFYLPLDEAVGIFYMLQACMYGNFS